MLLLPEAASDPCRPSSGVLPWALNMSLRQLLPGSADADSATSGGDGRSTSVVQWLTHTERELWYFVVAVMLVDVTLTVHGLQLGLEERNPIARRALDSAGVLGLYALKLMALVVGLCCRQLLPSRVATFVPLTLAIPSAIAVGINSALIVATLR